MQLDAKGIGRLAHTVNTWFAQGVFPSQREMLQAQLAGLTGQQQQGQGLGSAGLQQQQQQLQQLQQQQMMLAAQQSGMLGGGSLQGFGGGMMDMPAAKRPRTNGPMTAPQIAAQNLMLQQQQQQQQQAMMLQQQQEQMLLQQQAAAMGGMGSLGGMAGLGGMGSMGGMGMTPQQQQQQLFLQQQLLLQQQQQPQQALLLQQQQQQQRLQQQRTLLLQQQKQQQQLMENQKRQAQQQQMMLLMAAQQGGGAGAGAAAAAAAAAAAQVQQQQQQQLLYQQLQLQAVAAAAAGQPITAAGLAQAVGLTDAAGAFPSSLPSHVNAHSLSFSGFGSGSGGMHESAGGGDASFSARSGSVERSGSVARSSAEGSQSRSLSRILGLFGKKGGAASAGAGAPSGGIGDGASTASAAGAEASSAAPSAPAPALNLPYGENALAGRGHLHPLPSDDPFIAVLTGGSADPGSGSTASESSGAPMSGMDVDPAVSEVSPGVLGVIDARAVHNLHNARPHRCGVCGARFGSPGELGGHGRVHAIEAEAARSKGVASRTYYLPSPEWEAYGLEEDASAATGGADGGEGGGLPSSSSSSPAASSSCGVDASLGSTLGWTPFEVKRLSAARAAAAAAAAEANAGAGASNGPDDGEGGGRSPGGDWGDAAHTVPAPPTGGDVQCSVCGEPFRKAYDDESEAWVYRNAVNLPGGDGTDIAHVACAGPLATAVGGAGRPGF